MSNAADDAAVRTVIEVRVTIPIRPEAPVRRPGRDPSLPADAEADVAANDNDPGGDGPPSRTLPAG